MNNRSNTIHPVQHAMRRLALLLLMFTACGRHPSDQTASPETNRPPALPALETMLGPSLIDQNGNTHSISELHGKLIGLYFAAQWDPPSCYFTQHLIRFYERMKEVNQPFEVILISDDRTAQDMQAHMNELHMPWPALPKTDGGRQLMLKQRFAVITLPVLVILDGHGEVITTDGRSDVMRAKEKAYEIWR